MAERKKHEQTSLTGRNLGRVFSSRSGCACVMQLSCFETKLPNLMLKTRPKQPLGYLPLAMALPEKKYQKYKE
jgi:hypothetical protein